MFICTNLEGACSSGEFLKIGIGMYVGEAEEKHFIEMVPYPVPYSTELLANCTFFEVPESKTKTQRKILSFLCLKNNNTKQQQQQELTSLRCCVRESVDNLNILTQINV